MSRSRTEREKRSGCKRDAVVNNVLFNLSASTTVPRLRLGHVGAYFLAALLSPLCPNKGLSPRAYDKRKSFTCLFFTAKKK